MHAIPRRLPGNPSELGGGGIGAIVTDPPYGISLTNASVGKYRSARSFAIAGDGDTSLGLAVLRFAEAASLPTIAFASPWLPWPGHWRNLIAWDKGGAVGGGGHTGLCLKRSWELIQVARNGPLRGPRRESVWSYPILPADTQDHIAAKPVALMADLLRWFIEPGVTVCDPFMGSGSTGVACVQRGYRFIGIEIDPAHFNFACRRIRAELDAKHSRGPLFAEPLPLG